ncbi:MAG: flagellar motor protein MotB [Spirochaetaceae bacterium]|jgi:chemotaxis protein MotB|nr:flagellar motor protein MotB [Spirochaetaceae bacterium]
MAKKKKKKDSGGPSGNEWLTTYSDMVTLVLCFFAIMFNPDEVTPSSMAQLSVSFNARGMGANAGGNTLAVGRYADLGNNVLSLPAMDKGKSLGTALKKAVSLFAPEVHSKKMTITSDERGVVISLASDVFFEPASSRINIEQARDILLRLGTLLSAPDLFKNKFRIEGHTDSTPIDPNGPWTSNWQLSAMRAISVLNYLTALGLSDRKFQIAGMADTVPIAQDVTPEERALNRRVDVIILDEGHL